jgi:hypothetical protein
MVRRRPADILWRAGQEDRDFTIALTQVAFTIFEAYHPVDLLATLIRVGFSADHREERQTRGAFSPPLSRFQRILACNLSTIARASSVILINSGHGR